MTRTLPGPTSLLALLLLAPPELAQRARLARPELRSVGAVQEKQRGSGGPLPRFLFVDASATGAGTGRNWTDAHTDLADALDQARSGTTIFVAGGVYRPDRGTGNPGLHFDVPSDVQLLGGYAGGGAPKPFANDPDVHVTLLTGDLLGDDGPNFTNRSENSGGVAWVGAPTGEARGRVRGVTFRGSEGSPAVFVFSTARFERCRFEDSRATFRGGGMYAVADVVVEDCVFEGNRVDVASNFNGNTGGGGGLAVASFNGGLTVFLRRSTFSANRVVVAPAAQFSKYGGGMQFASAVPASDRLLAVDCVFAGNELEGRGPARGAGLQSDATTDLLRCDFAGNRIENASGITSLGGGLCSGLGAPLGGASNASRIVSCRFLGNEILADLGTGQATILELRGAGAYVAGGELQNCVAAGNRIDLDNPGGCLGRTLTGSGVAGFRLVARNSTIAHNEIVAVGSVGFFGEDTGGGLAHDDDSTAENTVLWANEVNGVLDQAAQLLPYEGAVATVSHSCVQGWTGALGGAGNVGVDPLLLDPDGPDDLLGTLDDDLRLAPTSPVADAGDNARTGADPLDLDDDGDTAESLPLDAADRARFQENPAVPNTGAGTAPLVDMGAYEGPG